MQRRGAAATEFETFGDSLLREFAPVLTHLLRRYQGRTLRALRRVAEGKPHTPPFRRMTRDQQFIFELVDLYGEIKASRVLLADSAAYLRRFSPHSKRVTEERYARYHLEAAHNEVYILQNRVDLLVKLLSRRYRHSLPDGAVPKLVSVFPRFVRTVLQPIVSARGAHVHEHRLKDSELRRLELYESLGQQHPQITRSVRVLNRHIRRETAKYVDGFVDDVDVVLNVVFGMLRVVLFDADGKLIYPPAPKPVDREDP